MHTEDSRYHEKPLLHSSTTTNNNSDSHTHTPDRQNSLTKLNSNNNKSNTSQKIKSENIDALVSRLYVKDTKSSYSSDATNGPLPTRYTIDYNDWKKKNNIPADTKVFAMTG